ncbi:MAG: diaminopimelate epimerase, partial [Bdellovibrionota bacterium]
VKNGRADARMEILNADGSMAEMCGNGIRAIALYLNRYGAIKKASYRIETLAGVLPVELQGNQVRVGMGIPKLQSLREEVLNLNGKDHLYLGVEVGVPHAVFAVDDVSVVPLETWGPVIENHSRFPNKTNVDFYQVLSLHKIKLRVWERGAGPTLACGTGACSTAVAAIFLGRAKSPLEVELPGGVLKIEWKGVGKPVIMTGPAVEVFRGEWSDSPACD